jgi:hypothetical protein
MSFVVRESYERPIFCGYQECAQICTSCKSISLFAYFVVDHHHTQALHIHPSDKAILYNIAMIQQKSAELLFSIKVAKRTLKDLQKVIDSASHAQK